MNIQYVVYRGEVYVIEVNPRSSRTVPYISKVTGIPMVDIVQNSGTTSFFKHWHTTTDDLQAISPESMRIVANVVLKTIYSDFPTKQ